MDWLMPLRSIADYKLHFFDKLFTDELWGHQVSQLDDIWGTDWVLASPAFGKFLTRDRFWALFSNLHLAHKSKALTETILILINYRYTTIQAQTSHKRSFQDNYNLGQNMSVDEAMVKGRSPNHLKQYMPMTTNDKGRLTHHKHRCNHSHSVEKHKERDTKDDWRHHCLCHCPTRRYKDYNAIMGAINKSYLASVVQKGNNTIQQINYYPADKNYINHLVIQWMVIYPVNSCLVPSTLWTSGPSWRGLTSIIDRKSWQL